MSLLSGKINMVVLSNTDVKLHYIYCQCLHKHIILSLIKVLEHRYMTEKLMMFWTLQTNGFSTCKVLLYKWLVWKYITHIWQFIPQLWTKTSVFKRNFRNIFWTDHVKMEWRIRVSTENGPVNESGLSMSIMSRK